MLRITSKFKIGKRLGAGVFEQCQTQKFSLSEARAKKGKRQRPPSDFGKQLIEKQRVRFTYGIAERQLYNYVNTALLDPKPTIALHRLLEQRLDSVAYRAGLATTRRAARQLVSHGHLTVNGKRMNVPSHHVRDGDVIAVREGSKGSALFASLAEKEHTPPQWITFDRAKLSGKIAGAPTYVPSEAGLDLALVLEYYSR